MIKTGLINIRLNLFELLAIENIHPNANLFEENICTFENLIV